MTNLLLLIMFIQVLLTFSVMIIMGRRRFSAARKGEIAMGDFTAMRLEGAPEAVRIADRNFINQFEVPLLFFIASVTALQLAPDNVYFIALAGAFVITRCMHSYVHLTHNTLKTRYYLFLTGCVLVLCMWLVLLVSQWVTSS